MNLPLSSVVADIVLQDLELHSLSNLSFILLFYFKYINDIALVIDKDGIDNYYLDVFGFFYHMLYFFRIL